jgi:hypothetical protein
MENPPAKEVGTSEILTGSSVGRGDVERVVALLPQGDRGYIVVVESVERKEVAKREETRARPAAAKGFALTRPSATLSPILPY